MGRVGREVNAVEATGLSKDYRGTAALSGMDLAIAPGEIVGLVGPDGAGKTTAIKLLAALLKPSAGRASVFGADTVRQPEAVRRQIGYMSQGFVLYPELTVRENLDFFSDLFRVGRSEKARRLEALLSFSRLGPFQGRLAGRLSGGMKQKLALSCALIHTPKLLLLDEPTTGVDPISRRELWKLLHEIWKGGVTMVVATPYMDEAERCGRVALMDKGRVLRCGSPDELKSGLGLSVYELEQEGSQDLQGMLAPLVDGLNRFGRKLHLYLRQPEPGLGRLEASLRGLGIGPGSLRRIEPSMEDVFLSLLPRTEEF
jgi:ABC-2 type transport system ATP-binding protein